MPSRIFSLLPEGLSPGWMIGLLLGIVQSSLITLLPADFTMRFWLLIGLILLLSLLVPLVAHRFISRKHAQTPEARKIAWYIGLTCAGLATLTPLLVYAFATFGKPAVPGSGFPVPNLSGDTVGSLLLLLLLNASGLVLALLGGKTGGMFGARRARFPAGAAVMRTVQGKRKLIGGLLGTVALALSVGVQWVPIVFAPPGWLATVISLGPVPRYALYPYTTSLPISLSSSPGLLYASEVPFSYALRVRDGSVVQKVPEPLFAASHGMLFTSVYEPDGDPSVSTPDQNTTTVRAFRESGGKPLWSSQLKYKWGAQLSDGTLYLDNEGQGIVRAIDPASGQTLWQYHCAAPACSFSMQEVMHDVVYLQDLENGMGSELALSSSTGTPLWHASLGFYLPRSLHIAGGQVIAQTDNTTITAFNALDGRQTWKSQAAMGGPIAVQSSAANEHVAFFQTLTGIFALRLDTGMLLWHWRGQPAEMYLADTILYLAAPTALVALDAATGQERWQRTYPSAENISIDHPANVGAFILGEANDIVYLHLGASRVMKRDLLLAFRAEDGRQVWQRSVESNLPPVPADQVAFGSASFFLGDDSIYAAAYEVESTEPYSGHFITRSGSSFQMTHSVVPALRAVFNTTTFSLAVQAIDGQTGQVRWHTHQVQTYRVA